IKKITFNDFQKTLKNKQFNNAWRRGKFLIAELKNDPHKLIFHFGMTGDFKYAKKDNLNKEDKQSAQLIIEFVNDYQLLWLNPRKLGNVYLVKDIKEIKTIKEMGPEALKLSQKEFLSLLNEHSTKNIKAFLMDQSDIAGIGNEYSNEILFQSEINPHIKIEKLSKEQRKKFYNTMKKYLKKAIELKPPDIHFPDSWLLAHQKDKKCPKNKNHQLKKETIAGRSALYCPQHQK
ncbi:MAG: Fpg/Nei family DNA glycosylase, partial [Candidatus Buchananbacteria bacterium]|nr:Fpg/Nei family DNA glycosylase [Candidatus Buchananbacteria bacterium]